MILSSFEKYQKEKEARKKKQKTKYNNFIKECARKVLGIKTTGKTIEQIQQEAIALRPDLYSAKEAK